ncbi:hypothetical protein ABPG74_017656 [Tetrahymena malaccensis]
MMHSSSQSNYDQLDCIKEKSQSQKTIIITPQEKLKKQVRKQKANKKLKKLVPQRVYYANIFQSQMKMQTKIFMLGEIMLDLNIFNLSQNISLQSNDDYEWHKFRPISQVKKLSDESILTYHNISTHGKLVFQDILQILANIPDQRAHTASNLFTAYQKRIQQSQNTLKQLQEFYSSEEIENIFAQQQQASVEKALKILDEKSKIKTENQVYMYQILTINPYNLLLRPSVIGQSKNLVEIIGHTHDLYESQMLRKGFLNLTTQDSQIQLLLLFLGFEKQVYLEGKTIEGYILPMKVSLESHLLSSLQLPHSKTFFNSFLMIYKVDINENILNNIKQHREEFQLENSQRNLDYELECWVFLQNYYKKKYGSTSQKRCGYKYINKD